MRSNLPDTTPAGPRAHPSAALAAMQGGQLAMELHTVRAGVPASDRSPALRGLRHNSPEGAARLIVLGMMADGRIDRLEWQRVQQQRIPNQLGLSAEEFLRVVEGVCEDVLTLRARGADLAATLGGDGLRGLLDDITDRALQRRVLDLCVQIAQADGELAPGESRLLLAMAEHWGHVPADMEVMG